MKIFCLIIIQLFLVFTAYANWNEIAYDKKYDELEGAAFFLALQADKKASVIRNLLPEFKSSLTNEEYDYFNLWAAQELQTPDIEKLIDSIHSESARVGLLKFHYFNKLKQDETAFTQLNKVSLSQQNVEALEFYLRLGLLHNASELFYHLVQTPEATYNFLPSLRLVQNLDKKEYLSWMEALQVVRPQDDLSYQLWVEVSPQYGPLASGQALRSYCRFNVLYCYNTAEFLRQNLAPQESWMWALRIPGKRDLTKFKIHSAIDSKSFSSVSLIANDIKEFKLDEEDRYSYALYYSFYVKGRCQDGSDLVKKLLQSSYQERVLKLEAKCRSKDKI